LLIFSKNFKIIKNHQKPLKRKMTEETISLKAKIREKLGKKVKALRKQKLLPAILYGYKAQNTPLEIESKDFEKIYEKAGQTTLINLDVPNSGPHKVLIHDLQFDPISGNIIHVDFHQVKMTEKIKTEVPIETMGDAPAVLELDGNLILNKDTIEIECLPQDLIHKIKVDISGLKTFEDKILIKDLKVPAKVEILNDPEEVVVLVTPPRTEEELAELEETPEEKVEKVEIEAEKEELEEGKEEIMPEESADEVKETPQLKSEKDENPKS